MAAPTVGRPKEMTWEVVAQDRHGLGGLAVTKETVKLYFAPDGRTADPLDGTGCHAAQSCERPAPAFLIAGNARLNLKPVLDRGYGVIACRVDQIQTGCAERLCEERSGILPGDRARPKAGPDEWERHRSVGVGFKPRDGLHRDGQRHRREASQSQ